MKIFTKYVIQWQPDGSLKELPEECESFEYKGPLALCGGIVGGGKGGSSPPPAPNYSQAAQQTQTSQFTNQRTPYGSQIYSPDASSPSGYRSDITLAPQAQNTLDTQMALSQNLGNLAMDQTGRVNAQYSQPMDMSSVGDIYNKAYSAYTSRLDPYWNQQTQMKDTELRNQGLVPGDQAYDAAMRDFNQAKNDAYKQAETGAISTMPQTYELAAAQYQQPLNIMNAIRTGAQIQNPQFTPSPGANYLGAAQAQGQYAGNVYNAQMDSRNSLMGGLFGLGAAAIPYMLT